MFLLLETMRLEDGRVVRLERHLSRMAGSARFFGYAWEEEAARTAVDAESAAHPRGVWRLRLLAGSDGRVSTECHPHDPGGPRVWRVGFAPLPVDETDPFLRNKTTHREVYAVARRARPDVDDVILWNGREEVTESTIANVVAEMAGQRVTPPIACGLLPGIFRAELLEAGLIQERVITREALAAATRIWLINSLREWVEAQLV